MSMFNDLPVVEVKRLSNTALVPTSAHGADAGLDLYANEDIFIKIGETQTIRTGIALGIPRGFYGKIEDRSSLALVGIRSGAGVVDSGYNGEIRVVLHNLNNDNESNHLGRGYQIKKGQRIAQLIVQSVVPVRLVEVEALETSERGANGFGSTGR